MVHVEEELDRAQHPVELAAGEIEITTTAGADRQEQRLVTREQFFDRRVATDTKRELDVDTQLDDSRDLAADELARQAVLRYPEHHHSAKAIGGLVDRHRVPRQPQLVSGAEARGPAPDDADGAEGCRRHRAVRLVPDRVGGRAAPTCPFARRRAHPTADRRERVRGARDEIRVAESPFGDGGDVRTRVGMHRTGGAARLVVPEPLGIGDGRQRHSDPPSGLQAPKDPRKPYYDHEKQPGRERLAAAARQAEGLRQDSVRAEYRGNDPDDENCEAGRDRPQPTDVVLARVGVVHGTTVKGTVMPRP